jgi:hypothetical protein
LVRRGAGLAADRDRLVVVGLDALGELVGDLAPFLVGLDPLHRRGAVGDELVEHPARLLRVHLLLLSGSADALDEALALEQDLLDVHAAGLLRARRRSHRHREAERQAESGEALRQRRISTQHGDILQSARVRNAEHG